MTDEVNMVIDLANESMNKAIGHLDNALSQIRAGKADTRMLDNIHVDYYGSSTPLAQVANINTPDARTIKIQPWDRKMIDVIEKAILYANIGFNPSNNGESIIISVPPLTEERRKDLVKQARNEGEIAKVSIRNARKDSNDTLKQLKKDGLSEDIEKDAEAQIQKLTDNYSVKVDELIKKKEVDIFTI